MRGAQLGALDHDAGDLLWRIHVDAAIALADHLAPRMTSGGRIVLIGSRAAKGVVGKSQYGAAKAALVGLARSWAKEVVARGITVNVVAPAATETAMLTDPARIDHSAGDAADRPPHQAGGDRGPGRVSLVTRCRGALRVRKSPSAAAPRCDALPIPPTGDHA